MKLVVVSHTPHYPLGGGISGWGPTVREIDHLARLFGTIVHVAPLYDEAAPRSALPYRSARVCVVPLSPAGGERLPEKIGVLPRVPGWARVILRECRSADVVHVRCPAGVSLVALALLPLVPRGARRWIKYAGNWRPDGRDPWTYRIQRRWLDSGRLRGLVTVNGEWPGQPPHVRSFYNPCLTEEELGQGRAVGERKTLSAPVRILFVGSLAPSKGATRALAVLEGLARRSVDAALDIAGGGPDQASLASRIEEAGLSDRVRIHGWMSRDALAPLFGRAHFVLSPSETEGWPKVLSEGMAYGAVPVSSGVSCIPQYLGRFRTGRTRAAHDVEGFAEAIAWYAGHPSDWKAESLLALEAARHFSYSRYLDAVRSLLELPAEGTGEAP